MVIKLVVILGLTAVAVYVALTAVMSVVMPIVEAM
jgi:hypothetical protein